MVNFTDKMFDKVLDQMKLNNFLSLVYIHILTLHESVQKLVKELYPQYKDLWQALDLGLQFSKELYKICNLNFPILKEEQLCTEGNTEGRMMPQLLVMVLVAVLLIFYKRYNRFTEQQIQLLHTEQPKEIQPIYA